MQPDTETETSPANDEVLGSGNPQEVQILPCLLQILKQLSGVSSIQELMLAFSASLFKSKYGNLPIWSSRRLLSELRKSLEGKPITSSSKTSSSSSMMIDSLWWCITCKCSSFFFSMTIGSLCMLMLWYGEQRMTIYHLKRGVMKAGDKYIYGHISYIIYGYLPN